MSGTHLYETIADLERRLREVEAAKDTAYTERNNLVAVFSRMWPSHLAQHPEDDASWSSDWMTIVCIHSPAGQLTWHVHDSHRHLFAHLPLGENHWDGHTTSEKYQRVAALADPQAQGRETP